MKTCGCCLTRPIAPSREQNPAKREVRYGITNLPPQAASAERLPELKRGHGIIENGLHYVKDVTLGEDRSLIHFGFGPMVMAALRDTTINLLHRTGHPPIASALRHFARHPPLAVSLVRGQNAETLTLQGEAGDGSQVAPAAL